MRLKNKIVMITGAGGQLGTRFAQSFAVEGAKLWLADLSLELLEKTAEQIPPENLIGTLIMDVTQPKSVKMLLHKYVSMARWTFWSTTRELGFLLRFGNAITTNSCRSCRSMRAALFYVPERPCG